MMKAWLKAWLIIALVAVTATSVYLRREKVRNSTDYTDPLRYTRMWEVGIAVDYMKEPVLAWKIVSGSKKLDLTGGGRVLTCMEEHLSLGDPFDAPRQPATIGEALNHCKEMRAIK